jgi:aryl-alcohol dehydrogenase-like predicted oxidoreductase
MKTRRLGRTDLTVSAIGFGAWAIGGSGYGPTEDGASLQALSYAFDQGVSFYDTADTYGHGHSEKLVGEVFQESSKRAQVVIATKVGWDFYHGGAKKNFDPEYIRFACGESLRRLKTDYIDLYQLHNPKLEVIEEGSIFKVLTQLKKEGKIRFWGVSIHEMIEGTSVIQNGTSDTIQVIYNLLDQRAREGLMPQSLEHDLGLIVREPLACGLLTEKYSPNSQFSKTDHRNRWTTEKLKSYCGKMDRVKTVLNSKKIPLKQAAIEFVLAEKAMSTVIPGVKTKAQLKDHLQACESPELTKQDLSKLKSLFHEDELFQTQ